MNDFGNRLRRCREERQMEMDSLAKEWGVPPETIAAWESGNAFPNAQELKMIADFYGVSMDWLMQESQEEWVSFKKGIHVREKDGARVDIGWNGIHVDQPQENTHVHIDRNGIFVQEKGKEKTNSKAHSFFKKFPFPLLAILAYLCFGFWNVCGGWGAGWLVLFLIPLYYSLIDAIAKKKPKHFAFPLLATMAFLFCGLFFGVWHPAWVIFFSIPLYYWVCDLVET